MRFAICDDNRDHINRLQARFDARKELHIETEPYESGEELVADYKKTAAVLMRCLLTLKWTG